MSLMLYFYYAAFQMAILEKFLRKAGITITGLCPVDVESFPRSHCRPGDVLRDAAV